MVSTIFPEFTILHRFGNRKNLMTPAWKPEQIVTGLETGANGAK
jgi:hypothetical protein